MHNPVSHLSTYFNISFKTFHRDLWIQSGNSLREKRKFTLQILQSRISLHQSSIISITATWQSILPLICKKIGCNPFGFIKKGFPRTILCFDNLLYLSCHCFPNSTITNFLLDYLLDKTNCRVCFAATCNPQGSRLHQKGILREL